MGNSTPRGEQRLPKEGFTRDEINDLNHKPRADVPPEPPIRSQSHP